MIKDKALALYEVAEGNSEVFGNKLVSKAYDAGVKAVLSELAMSRLLTLEDGEKVEFSEETKKQVKVCSNLYNQLMERIKEDPELVALLWNIDTEYSRLEMLSNEDYFVQAFIEGYNFRKTATGDKE